MHNFKEDAITVLVKMHSLATDYDYIDFHIICQRIYCKRYMEVICCGALGIPVENFVDVPQFKWVFHFGKV